MKTKVISIRLPEDLAKKAKKSGIDLKELVQMALEDIFIDIKKCPVCKQTIDK